MKLIAFFLFLIACPLAFGQSAKKRNKLLMTEFALEQQKQDSAYAVYEQTWKGFDSIRRVLNQRIRVLTEQERDLKRQFSNSNEVVSQLKRLGVETEEFTLSGSRMKEFPKSRESTKPIKDAFKAADVQFDKVSGQLNLDGLKVKEKNVLLTEKIREYKDYSKSNAARQKDLQAANERLKAFAPSVDSMAAVYESMENDLNLKTGKLQQKLNELQKNYTEKGPKGFPEAYRSVFPDVFPIPEEVNEVREVGVDEGFFGIDVVPAPKEEAPAPGINEVFTVVDEPASFPGGSGALRTYTDKNLRYPESMKEAAISGRVYVRFVVSQTGEISDVILLKGIPDCKPCDLEAIRFVKGMPKWIPAKNRGMVVKSQFNLPLVFGLK